MSQEGKVYNDTESDDLVSSLSSLCSLARPNRRSVLVYIRKENPCRTLYAM
jgi:hypothetical protein